jgi:hypothetical protein
MRERKIFKAAPYLITVDFRTYFQETGGFLSRERECKYWNLKEYFKYRLAHSLQFQKSRLTGGKSGPLFGKRETGERLPKETEVDVMNERWGSGEWTSFWGFIGYAKIPNEKHEGGRISPRSRESYEVKEGFYKPDRKKLDVGRVR